jgi:hypothetical protein
VNRPGLYRLARLLGGLGTAMLLILVVLIISAGISAGEFLGGLSGLSVQTPSGRGISTMGSEIVTRTNFSVPNPGFYAIDGLTLVAAFALPSVEPGPVAVARGGPVTIPGHANGVVPLVVPFNVNDTAGGYLLTHDAQLTTTLWANGTYAYLFPVAVSTSFRSAWGAPFNNLSILSGAARAQSNGTIAVPLNLTFSNDASSLVLDGSLVGTLVDASGTVCGHVAFPILDSAGPDLVPATAWLDPGCSATGLTLQAVFEANGVAFPLPPETIA